MQTILGAGGAIANELAKILAAKNEPFRLVGRKPKPIEGGEVFAADLTDGEQTIQAVSGSKVVYLLAGLAYDINVWRQSWPRIMANTIEACKRAQAKMLFFDNVYMYGRVAGAMTEETPYAPCSKKGEVRARIATALMDEVKAGNLTAMIARSADFYGPYTKNGVANTLVFEAFAKGAKTSWLANADVPHSLTFTPDAARGVEMLAGRESCWNQVWHLPTAGNPPTGRDLMTLAAREFGVEPWFRTLGPVMIRVGGWFNPTVRELHEMLYQNDSPYLFDSTKFAREFGFAGTPYEEGIHLTAESYKSAQAAPAMG